MEEDNVKPAAESTEPRPVEQKNYHAPELTVYGDVRELTMTNPVAVALDQFAEATGGAG